MPISPNRTLCCETSVSGWVWSPWTTGLRLLSVQVKARVLRVFAQSHHSTNSCPLDSTPDRTESTPVGHSARWHCPLPLDFPIQKPL
ncbi:hypothetical protein VTO42DRAFT_1019 [Malbranchea cinnamomea]